MADREVLASVSMLRRIRAVAMEAANRYVVAGSPRGIRRYEEAQAVTAWCNRELERLRMASQEGS